VRVNSVILTKLEVIGRKLPNWK